MTTTSGETHGPAARSTIAIAGASGFIGRALVRHLSSRGHQLRRLVRREARDASEIAWHPAKGEIDAPALEGTDVVINLSGESLDQRWTDDVKRAIRSSRVDATRLLAGTIVRMTRPPRAFLSGSAIGIYGDRGDEVLDETSPLGDDFLASVCREWESATDAVAQAGMRVVHLRTGVVFAKDGGALGRMLMPFRFGVGGKLGSGKQWMSWITREDYASAIEFLVDRNVSGAVNLVAPNPVRNADLTRALSHELHRPSWVPVPKLALEVLLGEMADAAVLASQRVMPRALMENGFAFHWPQIDGALASVLA